MDIHIFKKLILPLSLLTILSLFINHFLSYYGFFINLSTELISIIITILYVDYIIKKRESENWNLVEKRISEELKRFTNMIISSTNSFIAKDLDFSKYLIEIKYLDEPHDIDYFSKVLIDFTETFILPTISEKINILTIDDFKIIINKYNDYYKDLDRLFTLFDSKLTSLQYEQLLLVQVNLRELTSFNFLLTAIASTSEKSGISLSEMMQAHNITFSKYVENLLNNCIKLKKNCN